MKETERITIAIVEGIGHHKIIHKHSLNKWDLYQIFLAKNKYKFTRVYLKFADGKLNISLENWPVSEDKTFILGDPNVSIESMREYIMSIADMTRCRSDGILEGF